MRYYSFFKVFFSLFLTFFTKSLNSAKESQGSLLFSSHCSIFKMLFAPSAQSPSRDSFNIISLIRSFVKSFFEFFQKTFCDIRLSLELLRCITSLTVCPLVRQLLYYSTIFNLCQLKKAPLNRALFMYNFPYCVFIYRYSLLMQVRIYKSLCKQHRHCHKGSCYGYMLCDVFLELELLGLFGIAEDKVSRAHL